MQGGTSFTKPGVKLETPVPCWTGIKLAPAGSPPGKIERGVLHVFACPKPSRPGAMPCWSSLPRREHHLRSSSPAADLSPTLIWSSVRLSTESSSHPPVPHNRRAPLIEQTEQHHETATMADEVPLALKQADINLYKTATRAAQLQTVKPIIAYWCTFFTERAAESARIIVMSGVPS